MNRISGIFLKRHINIEGLNVSKSEIEGVSKFTIVVNTTEDWTRKIVGQIEKQIEVIKAYYHTDDETIYQESALFKIASSLLFDERQIQNIIKESNSQIVTVSRDFFVLAKTGRRHEVDEMRDALEPYLESGQLPTGGIVFDIPAGKLDPSDTEEFRTHQP